MNKIFLGATSLASAFLLVACGDKTSSKPEPTLGNDMKSEAQDLAPGVGVIQSIDSANKKVTLDHRPIPEIGWPAMEMTFDADAGLEAFKEGDNVSFVLRKETDGSYAVAMMCPTLGDPERDSASLKAMMEKMKGTNTGMMKDMHCPEGISD